MDDFNQASGVEGDFKMIIHLDSDSVGHGYVEMARPGFGDQGTMNSEFFGKYPDQSTIFEKVELWDNGIIADDRARFEAAQGSDEINLVSKEIILTEDQFQEAMTYIAKEVGDASDYELISDNCADFVQNVYSSAFGEESGSFTDEFSDNQIENLSWLENYLDFQYPQTPPIIEQSNDLEPDPWDLGDPPASEPSDVDSTAPQETNTSNEIESPWHDENYNSNLEVTDEIIIESPPDESFLDHGDETAFGSNDVNDSPQSSDTDMNF